MSFDNTIDVAMQLIQTANGLDFREAKYGFISEESSSLGMYTHHSFLWFRNKNDFVTFIENGFLFLCSNYEWDEVGEDEKEEIIFLAKGYDDHTFPEAFFDKLCEIVKRETSILWLGSTSELFSAGSKQSRDIIDDCRKCTKSKNTGPMKLEEYQEFDEYLKMLHQNE